MGFYKQAAPLGLKRFGDGLFYKTGRPAGAKEIWGWALLSD
jgi:hypothetical protein